MIFKQREAFAKELEIFIHGLFFSPSWEMVCFLEGNTQIFVLH